MTELATGTTFPALLLAGACGAALGALFFGGLWWTVERLPRAERPTLLFVVSFVLRTATAAAGFLLVAQGSWERALACLAGFLLARTGVRLRVARTDSSRPPRRRDAAHPG